MLVHEGFVTGSGRQGVYAALKADGYTVAVVRNPTISLDGDVGTTRQVIDAQPGPVTLVGHSYGGAVITDHDKVASLVAIARTHGEVRRASPPTPRPGPRTSRRRPRPAIRRPPTRLGPPHRPATRTRRRPGQPRPDHMGTENRRDRRAGLHRAGPPRRLRAPHRRGRGCACGPVPGTPATARRGRAAGTGGRTAEAAGVPLTRSRNR
ncbi:alpha/beta fold hydrolase [Streptomyces sp. SID5474]|nr:alpha/beta fold hydrolase [Embleya scabrispora]MYS86309.1 alpha/beta fold hydrolase [Streptomyces sp. SID5474]